MLVCVGKDPLYLRHRKEEEIDLSDQLHGGYCMYQLSVEPKLLHVLLFDIIIVKVDILLILGRLFIKQ